MSQILDYNPLTGEYVTFDYDDATDSVTLGHHQDVTPILDQCKEAAADVWKHKQQAKDEWAHYATVPNVVALEWLQKYGVDFYSADPAHRRGVMRLLNDPDYKYLKRTTYKHDR